MVYVLPANNWVIPMSNRIKVREAGSPTVRLTIDNKTYDYYALDRMERTTVNWFTEFVYIVKVFNFPQIPNETFACMLDEPDEDVVGFLACGWCIFDQHAGVTAIKPAAPDISPQAVGQLFGPLPFFLP